MLRASDRPTSKTRSAAAIGSGAVALALLFVAACLEPTPSEPPLGGAGGQQAGGAGSGGKGGGSGGKGGKGGTPGTGGNGGTPGAGGSGGGEGGAGGDGAGGAMGGSGGAAGGSDGGAMGGAGGAMGGSGGEMGGSGGGTDWPAPCTTEPAATVPALKATPVAKLPNNDGAGQIFGVPGEKGVYVLGHRSGKVYYVVDGKVDPTPMAQVAIKNNAPQDEQGLLGVALHPNFKQNQLFYLLYTAMTTGNIRIEELKRMSMTSSMRTKTVWDKARTGTGSFHNGGQISFSAKDNGKALLYHSVGNNSSAAADAAEGVAGRVLVHDIDAGTAKTVGHGLRNPYRMHIDRLTGDMYVGETNGPAGGTIRFSPFASPVTDYGFPKGGNQGATVPSPFAGIEGSKALIGGVVYRGKKIPAICGRYFYGGWPEGNIKTLVPKDGKAVKANAGVTVDDLSSFGEDGEGEIYMAGQNGDIFKLEAN